MFGSFLPEYCRAFPLGPVTADQRGVAIICSLPLPGSWREQLALGNF